MISISEIIYLQLKEDSVEIKEEKLKHDCNFLFSSLLALKNFWG